LPANGVAAQKPPPRSLNYFTCFNGLKSEDATLRKVEGKAFPIDCAKVSFCALGRLKELSNVNRLDGTAALVGALIGHLIDSEHL